MEKMIDFIDLNYGNTGKRLITMINIIYKRIFQHLYVYKYIISILELLFCAFVITTNYSLDACMLGQSILFRVQIDNEVTL